MTANHGLTPTELAARVQMALSEAGYPSPRYHFIEDGELKISDQVPDKVIYQAWEVCTGAKAVICLECFSKRVLVDGVYDLREPCTHT